MTNPVVNLNVSRRIAPAPSTLQKTAALISQGATNTSPGTITLLKQKSDLTPVLAGGKAISTITWSGSVATVTTAAPHGWTNGDTLPVTISGAVPAGYNGTFTGTITGASTLTYPLASNPGSETVPGVVTVEDVAELNAMVTTFFAQGVSQAVSILELGAGNAADGVTFLNAWITANPKVFYAYLVPRFWDAVASFLTFAANFTALDAKTYFFVTTTLQNWRAYTALKSIFLEVEAPAYGVWPANALTAISFAAGVVTATTTTAHTVAPGQYFTIAGVTPSGYNGTFLAIAGTAGTTLKYALASDPGAETVLGTLQASLYSSAGVPSTEFSAAASLYDWIVQTPSSTNRVAPMNFRFQFGVTPFPTQGNAALLSTLNAANVSVVGTGAQGGISDKLLIGGNMLDGNPANYWYSVDWAQVTAALDVTAYLISGAQPGPNPVNFNQAGINGGQGVLTATMAKGLSFGLVLNPIKQLTLTADDYAAALDAGTYDGYTLVNADPFASYVTENPDDYKAGAYNGYSIDYVPLRGFESITINLTVSDFAG